ncbi:hypothetical protein GBF38_002812, partial [Nibea albiflora]
QDDESNQLKGIKQKVRSSRTRELGLKSDRRSCRRERSTNRTVNDSVAERKNRETRALPLTMVMGTVRSSPCA